MAAWGFVARRRKLTAAGLIGVFLTAWPPVAWLTVPPLQGWYSLRPPDAAGAEAIVVLAGAIMPPESPDRQPVLTDSTYLRCRYGLWIWKRNPRLPLLLCGGPMPGSARAPPG